MSGPYVSMTPAALHGIAREFNAWRAAHRARLARSRRYVAKQRRAAARREGRAS